MRITKYRIVVATLVLGFALFYLFFWRDPIFRMEVAAARNPMFYSGFATMVHLPECATLEEVIKATSQFGQNIRIVETKKLLNRTTPALVESEHGEKIALVDYNGTMGWFVQVRDP